MIACKVWPLDLIEALEQYNTLGYEKGRWTNCTVGGIYTIAKGSTVSSLDRISSGSARPYLVSLSVFSAVKP